jgi:hypothetical protein
VAHGSPTVSPPSRWRCYCRCHEQMQRVTRPPLGVTQWPKNSVRLVAAKPAKPRQTPEKSQPRKLAKPALVAAHRARCPACESQSNETRPSIASTAKAGSSASIAFQAGEKRAKARRDLLLRHLRMGYLAETQVNLTFSERGSLKLNATPDVGKDRSTLPSAS